MRDCMYNIVVNYRNGDRILGAHEQATIVKSVSYKYNERAVSKYKVENPREVSRHWPLACMQTDTHAHTKRPLSNL